jgi:type I protein arginine methyltransferase
VPVLTDEHVIPGAGPELWPSFGEYPVYDDVVYQTFTTDSLRNERFRSALSALAPGRTVLDIGTGQELYWARESVLQGARHVFAMEVMPESYRIACVNHRKWKLADRVTLLQGLSTVLEIAPKADVCVSEIIGSVAGAEGAAAVLTDARRRHLLPGGVFIPDRSATLAAAACLRKILDTQHVAFSPGALPYLARIFAWNGGPFDVRLRIRNPAADGIVSSSEQVELLEFNGELLTAQEREVSLVVQRRGRVDGVLTWMRLWCRPGEPPLDALRDRTNWATVYFPLFREEIPVEPGDRLDLRFTVSLSDDGIHPDYQLTAMLRTSHGGYPATHVSAHHGQTFRADAQHRRLFPEGAADARPALRGTISMI